MNKIIESIWNSCIGYINTRYQLLQLELRNKAAGFIHTLINVLILVFVILITIIFVNISLILLIRDITGSLSIGVYSLTFIYICLFLYIVVGKKDLFPKKIIDKKLKKSEG